MPKRHYVANFLTKKRSRIIKSSVPPTCSLEPIISNMKETVKVLILGTHPSRQSLAEKKFRDVDIIRRGGSGPQNYGHPRNSFWMIAGSALGFYRHQIPYDKQCDIFTSNGYALWDVIHKCSGPGSLDSDIDRKTMVANKIPELVVNCPNLNRICLAKSSAELFKHKNGHKDWLTTGKFAGTHFSFVIRKKSPSGNATLKSFKSFTKNKNSAVTVSLTELDFMNKLSSIVVPSTSPANAIQSPAEKEVEWHKSCYNLKEPPITYKCVACCKNHWFQDCQNKYFWMKKQESKSKCDLKDEVNGDRWYFRKLSKK
eukprot:GSMAST32.ASY1.ANO1.1283.1 assembled CDS